MKAYNQKIIETPTYLEIYDYEAMITPKRKTSVPEISPERKEQLAWLYEEEQPTTDKRKKYDELSAQGQYDSLKRKQQHYKNMRFEIARLVDMNFDNQPKFLTLTFRENIQHITYANNELKKFIKRLNYDLYQTKTTHLKYLATWEKQKRGAIHYHIILFAFPFISVSRLTTVWRNGFVKINKIDVDSAENRGRYISKYFDKALDLKEHKKKAFFKSRNLQLPAVTKKLAKTPYDFTNQDVLYTSEYLVRRPIFYHALNDLGHPEQKMDFQESIVRYTKIKK
ncbi:rolling circle replication-associated protein [Listeria innocua]|uniref:rolling circle replication-associated protein n=1 Tax=Listeria innocua TaxID=1642 RepID=UPI001628E546|nr:Rep protein [Listeria innocua]MBC1928812.1 Rep protein [Listeria innocua]